MNTYRELLEKLNTLTPEQLDNKIFILNQGLIEDKKIELVINEQSLYEFRDTGMEIYYDFEDDDIATEYVCTKILNKNYPIIKL